MFRYLEELRKSPPPARRRAAFFLSALITGFIFFIWILTILATPPDPSKQNSSSGLRAIFAPFTDVLPREVEKIQEKLSSLEEEFATTSETSF